MRYINTQNGAVIETECEITGGLWKLEASVAIDPQEETEPQEEAKPEKKGKGKK